MNRRMRFGFVLTEEEKRALCSLAEVEGGLSEAAMLRRLIRRAAQEKGLSVRATARVPRVARSMRVPSEQIAG